MKKELNFSYLNTDRTYSFSSLSEYNECKYSFFLNKMLGIKGCENIYSNMGGCVHELLEKLQREEITTEVAIQEFELNLLENRMNDITFSSEKIESNYTLSIIDYFSEYKTFKDDIVDFEIEKEFNIEINGIKIKGFIDLVLHHNDGSVTVIDYKTSSKYSKADLADKGLQLILYAYAYELLTGKTIRMVCWDMLKYCNVDVDGSVKTFANRNKWIEECKSKISKLCKNYNLEMDIESASEFNDILFLPTEIQDKIIRSRCLLEYPYNEETKTQLLSFITNTVAEINKNTEYDWDNHRFITKSSEYFCLNLCDYRTCCKYLDNYLQRK